MLTHGRNLICDLSRTPCMKNLLLLILESDKFVVKTGSAATFLWPAIADNSNLELALLQFSRNRFTRKTFSYEIWRPTTKRQILRLILFGSDLPRAHNRRKY